MRQTDPVRARSAVFDVYGDHLSSRGHWGPVAALVTLLASTGISGPATRTAISRLASQGWLEPRSRDGARGYAATSVLQDRLAGAHARIYRSTPLGWDGRWQLLTVERPAERSTRDRVAATLGFLGYGRLAGPTWVAARRSEEVEPELAALGVASWAFAGEHLGDPVALAAKVWDLGDLAAAYRASARETERLLRDLERADQREALSNEQAYALRAELVHRWRTFLFSDPGLPAQVLPADWPEPRARALFLQAAEALQPAARRFVDETLAAAGAARSPGVER